MSWYAALLAAVALERVLELVVSRRHERAMLARGGTEYGAGHYPFMVVLHTGLLIGCAVEVLATNRPFEPALGWSMLVLVAAAQVLRWWCVGALGEQWSTRVIVSRQVPLVARGPYRFIRHPNYVAVVAEGAALPLVHSAWVTAACFTVLNAALLTVRIRVENAALRTAPHASSPVPDASSA